MTSNYEDPWIHRGFQASVEEKMPRWGDMHGELTIERSVFIWASIAAARTARSRS